MELKNIDEKWFSDKLEFLLTTKGNEKGFGVCFAKKFVQKIQNKNNCALQNSMVIREYPISVSKSTKFIDILYLDLDKKDNVVIAVENKFLTQDSKNQLDNYVTALNSLFSQNDVKVVYLTLNGKPPVNYEGERDDVVRLSWLDDILEMVLECYFAKNNKALGSLDKMIDTFQKQKSPTKEKVNNQIIELIDVLIQIRNLKQLSSDECQKQKVNKDNIIDTIIKILRLLDSNIHKNSIVFEYIGKCYSIKYNNHQIFIPILKNNQHQLNHMIKYFCVNIANKTINPDVSKKIDELLNEIHLENNYIIECEIKKYLDKGKTNE